MFDFLENDNELAITETTSQNNSNSYQSKGGKYGGGGFQAKPLREAPYVPVTIFVLDTYPENVKNILYKIADKLVNKGIVVRINGYDKAFVEKVSKLSKDNVELYLPWKNFNDLQSKHTWNPDELKNIAKSCFGGWDKVKDTVKALLTCDVRMIVGDKNNSCTNDVIIYTEDGASKTAETSKDTGKLSTTIKMAEAFYVPVTNLKKDNQVAAFAAKYGLT